MMAGIPSLAGSPSWGPFDAGLLSMDLEGSGEVRHDPKKCCFFVG